MVNTSHFDSLNALTVALLPFVRWNYFCCFHRVCACVRVCSVPCILLGAPRPPSSRLPTLCVSLRRRRASACAGVLKSTPVTIDSGNVKRDGDKLTSDYVYAKNRVEVRERAFGTRRGVVLWRASGWAGALSQHSPEPLRSTARFFGDVARALVTRRDATLRSTRALGRLPMVP